jgi:hypothetical protein
MIRQLKQFFGDESGGIVDTIVTIGLVVIIAGGVLYAILGGMQDIGDAVQNWICAHIPGACS